MNIILFIVSQKSDYFTVYDMLMNDSVYEFTLNKCNWIVTMLLWHIHLNKKNESSYIKIQIHDIMFANNVNTISLLI